MAGRARMTRSHARWHGSPHESPWPWRRSGRYLEAFVRERPQRPDDLVAIQPRQDPARSTPANRPAPRGRTSGEKGIGHEQSIQPSSETCALHSRREVRWTPVRRHRRRRRRHARRRPRHRPRARRGGRHRVLHRTQRAGQALAVRRPGDHRRDRRHDRRRGRHGHPRPRRSHRRIRGRGALRARSIASTAGSTCSSTASPAKTR